MKQNFNISDYQKIEDLHSSHPEYNILITRSNIMENLSATTSTHSLTGSNSIDLFVIQCILKWWLKQKSDIRRKFLANLG